MALAWTRREENGVNIKRLVGVSPRETRFHVVVPDSGGKCLGKAQGRVWVLMVVGTDVK